MNYLDYKINNHWYGINRQKNMITKNMPQLRKSLKMLLNENQPINKRLNNIKDPKSEYYIKGFGKATLTPILLFSNENKYGIYNRISERGLKIIGMHPKFEKKDKL